MKTLRPIIRSELYKDGERIAEDLYPSHAQVLVVLLSQFMPEHKWEVVKIVTPPPMPLPSEMPPPPKPLTEAQLERQALVARYMPKGYDE